MTPRNFYTVRPMGSLSEVPRAHDGQPLTWLVLGWREAMNQARELATEHGRPFLVRNEAACVQWVVGA